MYLRFKLYDLMMAKLERISLREYREKLLNCTYGKTLEIGAGTGANLPFMKNISSLFITDKDKSSFNFLKNKIEQYKLNASFICADCQNLPFEDNSFNTVVSTLVLCSTENQKRALLEIHRILKPGGRLLFIEHVRGKNIRAWFQDKLMPIWKFLANGCCINRSTVLEIENTGFLICKLEKFNPGKSLWKINSWPLEFFRPFVYGIAIRKENHKEYKY